MWIICLGRIIDMANIIVVGISLGASHMPYRLDCKYKRFVLSVWDLYLLLFLRARFYDCWSKFCNMLVYWLMSLSINVYSFSSSFLSVSIFFLFDRFFFVFFFMNYQFACTTREIHTDTHTRTHTHTKSSTKSQYEICLKVDQTIKNWLGMRFKT